MVIIDKFFIHILQILFLQLSYTKDSTKIIIIILLSARIIIIYVTFILACQLYSIILFDPNTIIFWYQINEFIVFCQQHEQNQKKWKQQLSDAISIVIKRFLIKYDDTVRIILWLAIILFILMLFLALRQTSTW